MSGNFFVDFVFLFLICYALISIFYNLSDFLMKRYCKYPSKLFFVLSLKHKSETLERDLRCAVSKSLAQKCALVIVCDNLNLEENKVVWRVTDAYEHIIVTTQEDMVKKLDDAQNISMSL